MPASTRATGAEKVNLIGVSGPMCAVGLGETSTTGRRDFGNQVTPTRGPSLSHGRAAAASATEPAAVLVGSVTVRPATRAPATETRSTGVSKRTSARAPCATVSHRFDDLCDRCLHGQGLAPIGAERPAFPAGTPNDHRKGDPLARRDLHARGQPAMRDNERDRASIGPLGADAYQRARERLQLDATEREPIGDEPCTRERPDDACPRSQNHNRGKGDHDPAAAPTPRLRRLSVPNP